MVGRCAGKIYIFRRRIAVKKEMQSRYLQGIHPGVALLLWLVFEFAIPGQVHGNCPFLVV